MRESLGTRLRQQREAQHVTIASIATATKISAALFSGLERDDVTGWPSGIYRRSFVRAYAEAVGLDPDAVCREFNDQYPDLGKQACSLILSPLPMSKHLGDWQRVLSSSGDPVERLDRLLKEARLPRAHHVRWQAAAWDGFALLLLAVCAVAMAGHFWMPLGVAAVCYHVGGTLLLGKSPALWWLERRAGEDALAPEPVLGQTVSPR